MLKRVKRGRKRRRRVKVHYKMRVSTNMAKKKTPKIQTMDIKLNIIRISSLPLNN